MTMLREEKGGKKETSVSSILKLQHLQKLAKCAGVPPPLAALFGHHLASNAEAAGVPLDSSWFLCQRCETMLQPGFNCTIRIEKNVKNKGRQNKSISTTSKNNMVYTCHFCSHRNIKWGTPTGHVEGLLASRLGSHSHSNAWNKTSNQNPHEKILEVLDANSELKSFTRMKAAANTDNMHVDVKTTDAMRTMEKTTDAVWMMEKSLSALKKKRKASKSHQSEIPIQGSSSERIVDSGKGASASNKWRRKSWSSLREKAESNELHKVRNLSNIVISFHL
ncbi:RNAse P Rpr2/Rpp21 subunit protein [Dioscorea alata]|uniref:RNAse P Rpr2/Rpp21 subunit protein n=1 Tax=Dioscorea alata TaxID=55571 RepID=A0ACB7VI42_DIOAL|nr:RNAse P Rpr2/Rpp21 subunit protein [Dioscorea alata]